MCTYSNTLDNIRHLCRQDFCTPLVDTQHSCTPLCRSGEDNPVVMVIHKQITIFAITRCTSHCKLSRRATGLLSKFMVQLTDTFDLHPHLHSCIIALVNYTPNYQIRLKYELDFLTSVQKYIYIVYYSTRLATFTRPTKQFKQTNTPPRKCAQTHTDVASLKTIVTIK